MPHFIDLHVGKRLRLRRTLFGLTQIDLAKHVGVSFQQIQKYEVGSNRVSASRLWLIAQVLNVDVSYFFEELMQSNVEECALADQMAGKDVIAMVRAFIALPERQRLSVLDLAKALV